MTRYLVALALAACAPDAADEGVCDPPRQTRAVRLDAAGSGLDAELEEVAAWYRELGYDVEVDAGGADTVPIEWVHTPHLGYWDGTRIVVSLDHALALDDEDGCDAPFAVEVLRHEVGHAMGFSHVASAADVMAPTIGWCDHRARLCASPTTGGAVGVATYTQGQQCSDEGAAVCGYWASCGLPYPFPAYANDCYGAYVDGCCAAWGDCSAPADSSPEQTGVFVAEVFEGACDPGARFWYLPIP